MNNTKVISESIYHQIEKEPFIFYEYVQEDYDNNVSDYWLARNEYIRDKCKGETFDTYEIEVALAIVQIPGKEYQQGEYEICIRPISTKSINDLSALLNHFLNHWNINRSFDLISGTSYKEILWFLYHCDWSPYLLTRALELLEDKDRQFVLKLFGQICVCLSQKKQNQIEAICNQFGLEYEPYKPLYFKEAYDIVFPPSILPKSNYDNSSIGMFELVAAINGDNWFWSNYEFSFINIGMTPPLYYDARRLQGINSPLINVARWINSIDTLPTCDDLECSFWLYSPSIRIKLLRQYFNTIIDDLSRFDKKWIYNLITSKYLHFGTFWHYLYEPWGKVENNTLSLLEAIIETSLFDNNCDIPISIERVKCILKTIDVFEND